MNFENLQKTWGLQTVSCNRLTAPAIQQLLAGEVRQRTHAMRRTIAVAAFVVVVGWSVVIGAHVSGIKPLNLVTISAFVIGSLFDFAFFALAFLSLRQMKREAAGMGETLFDAVRGSLRVVESQQRDCGRLVRGSIALLVVSIALFALKGATGNLPVQGVVAGIVVSGLFTAGVVATVRRYQREELSPRRSELQQQLEELKG